MERSAAAGEWWPADIWGHRALWHFERAGMELEATRAARLIGDLRTAAGDPLSARRYYAEAISEARDLGAEREQGLAALGMGRAAMDLSDVTTARRLAQIAEELLERAAAPPGGDRGGTRAARRGEGGLMTARRDARRDMRVAIVGAGVMAEAMIAGLLADKAVAPSRLIASHPRRDRRDLLASAPRDHHGDPQRGGGAGRGHRGAGRQAADAALRHARGRTGAGEGPGRPVDRGRRHAAHA